MKFPFIAVSLFLFSFAFPALAQHPANQVVYLTVEQPPRFPGGQDSLLHFIYRNTRYPEAAREKGEHGTTFISFVIDPAGQVKDPQILKSAAPSLDAEAIRVISSLPRWVPGKQNGEAVAVKFTLPVKFQLQDPEQAVINSYPEFSGGEAALTEFIARKLKYPAEAMKKPVEGNVVLNFTVQTTGKIADVRVEKSPDVLLSTAAINLLFSMPDWQPARINSQAISLKHTISIPFNLRNYQESPAAKEPATSQEQKKKQPRFPGGEAAMMRFLATNISYPEVAQREGAEGLVVLSFMVDKSGHIKHLATLESAHPALDLEARRIVAAMPEWRPGTLDGVPVNVRFTLPIRFTIR